MGAPLSEIMNWVDRRISERLLQFKTGAGAGPTTPSVTSPSMLHHILSTTHDDTTADAVQRGDLIVGKEASPLWKRLAKGSANAILTLDANDVLWSTGFLSITAAKTLTVQNTLTLAGAADDYVFTIPGTGTAVLTARQVSAGNGLSGGGDLSADRTISMGTPSTITVSSTNSVGTGTHNHTLDLSGRSVSSGNGLSGGGTLAEDRTLSVNQGYAFAWTASHSWSLNLSTPDFTSGWTGSGWRVDNGVTQASRCSAEFDNLTIRNRMNVYELLINQIRATNGSILVSNTGKVKEVEDLYETWEDGDAEQWEDGDLVMLEHQLVTTEDVHGFAAGDLIRAQRFSGSQGEFQSDGAVVSAPSTTTFNFALLAGSDAMQVGYEYVRLGNPNDADRQGGIYLTPDEANAPYIDIFDGVTDFGEFGTAGVAKARLGKLTGITDAVFGALSGYGLWTEAGYFTGSINATAGKLSGLEISGVLSLGTAGGIYQGTGSFASPTTGLKIWNDSGIGRIAGYESGVIQAYFGTDGKLYSGGGKVSIDGSGIFIQRGYLEMEIYNKLVWANTHTSPTAAYIAGYTTGVNEATLSIEINAPNNVWLMVGTAVLGVSDGGSPKVAVTGDLTVSTLVGSGNRPVYADSNGKLYC